MVVNRPKYNDTTVINKIAVISDKEFCLYLFLSLPHGKELQLVPTKSWPLRKLHKITGRIWARTEYKYDRRERVRLLEYCLKADHRGCHVFLTHSPSYEVCDSEIHSVNTETAKEQQALEVSQAFFVFARKWGRFWSVVVIPLERNKTV